MLASLRSASHHSRSSLRSSGNGQIRTLAEAAAWSPLPFHRRPVREDRTTAGRRFRDGVAWATHSGDPLWWEQNSGWAVSLLLQLQECNDPTVAEMLWRLFQDNVICVRRRAPASVLHALNKAVAAAGGVESVERWRQRFGSFL